jgi:hypothetical protein
MNLEAMVDIYIEVVHKFPCLDIGLLASRDGGGALLLAQGKRAAFIEIIDRESTLIQVAAFIGYLRSQGGYEDRSWLN